MASIKISQLPVGGSIVSTDELPVSRGGLETYRILANQIVTTGGNVGGAAGVYRGSDTTIGSTTLRFRSLSAVGEGIQVIQTANTINISISGQNPSKDVFTGTGSQTIFALSNSSSRNANNYRVDIDGVLQEPGQTADYFLSGSNLTFTSAPPLSSKIVVVSNNLLPLIEAVPADNSITNAMFTDGCINTAELSSGAVTTDKIALSAVTADRISLVTSLSTNGYQIMPGGLIMQWGNIGPFTTQASPSAIFPVPFPNNCIHAQVTARIITAGVSGPFDIFGQIVRFDTNRLQMQVQNANTDSHSSVDLFWLALGY